MIAMSDAVILFVSAGVLGSGIYQWQQSIEQPKLASQNNISVQATSVVSNTVQNSAPSISSPSMDATTQYGAATGSQGNLMGRPVNAAPASVERKPVSMNDGTAVNGPVNESVNESVIKSVNGPVKNASTAAQPALYGLHRVESGDSLSVLSNRFGTTVSELKSINSISGSQINIGQELYYPLPAN